MAAAREKIPQLGLWDDEVPKLSHDKMVLWAYENAEAIVRRYLSAFPKRDFGGALSTEWASQSIRIRSGEQLSDLPPLPPKPAQLVGRKILEQVIEQYPEVGHGRTLPRILGYADLVIVWWSPYVEWDANRQEWQISGSECRLLVEAKTVLPSLGELMRQLNLYRLVLGDVAVVAPDASHADILREQSVLVVPYEDT